MYYALKYLLLIFLGCFGEFVLDFVDPPSGSVIGEIAGKENVTALTCNISNNASGISVHTRWSLENFKGTKGLIEVPVRPNNYTSELFLIGGDHCNQLTVLNLTEDLDHVRISCGTGTEPQMAYFTLRINRMTFKLIVATIIIKIILPCCYSIN